VIQLEENENVEAKAKESDVADIIGADTDEIENSEEETESNEKSFEQNSHPETNNKDVNVEKNAPMIKSDKVLIVSVVVILLIIAAFFSVRYFMPKQKVVTLDDINKENIEGKLDPELGYVYKGAYSFIYNDGLWLLQLKSPQGTAVYNIALHYGARDVENITVIGGPTKKFTDSEDFYVTFNPTASDLQYTALAVSELDNSLIKSFQKKPIAACDRNETSACFDRPIVTCETNSSIPVIYFQNADGPRAVYVDNCLIIQGSGLDLVRVVDRILLQWYKVMD